MADEEGPRKSNATDGETGAGVRIAQGFVVWDDQWRRRPFTVRDMQRRAEGTSRLTVKIAPSSKPSSAPSSSAS
jgi:hypothetical protein